MVSRISRCYVKNEALYIDKTLFVDKIVKSKSQYYFLTRPRRFGKSLFLSTLRYFFEGERELFKNLYIDSTDWNWEKYPVLYIDLNNGEYIAPNNLENVIEYLLAKWEERYGIEKLQTDITTRFRHIIEKVHEKTGKQVVILVDEYDKPLVKNLDKDKFDDYIEKLSALYSNFKSCAQHIKIVFMAGVRRFSKLSVFSGLNNLNDISFDNEFADICGITEKEKLDNFQPGIKDLAKSYGISIDDACKRLKENYDGYRFAEKGSEIYNPWSLLNCMQKCLIANYWNETGFPSIVAKSLKHIHADLEEIFNTYCSLGDLKGLDLTNPNPIALMYQTGYLTIKDFDLSLNMLHIGIPNKEVKEGLVKVLIPYYAKYHSQADAAKVGNIIKWIKLGNLNKFMESVQAYFSGVSYMLKMENENNFHNAFFLITNLIGIESDAEFTTTDGRIDMIIRTLKYVYMIELKYDKSADEALAQIDRKKYDRMFYGDPRKIFKIGVEFSSKTRTIENWKIEGS